MLKKLAIGLLVLVLVGIGALVFLQWHVFGGLQPIDPDASLERATVVVEGGFTTTWIVEAADGQYLLVDAGLAGDGSAIKAKLEEMGVSPNDVIAIALTHGHGDHIAGAASFPNAKVYIHEEDVAIAEGTAKSKGTVSKLFSNDYGVQVDETFTDGDVLTFGDRTLTVYHTPGHTAGHSCFLLDGALFLGDAAGVEEGGELRPPPDIFTDDPAEAIASVRRLSERFESEGVKPEILVPTHSGVSRDVDALKRFAENPPMAD